MKNLIMMILDLSIYDANTKLPKNKRILGLEQDWKK